MLSRVRLAIIWLNPRKLVHSKGYLSKHCPTGSHAAQQRTNVPKCLFLQARTAVAAIKSLAFGLPGVLRKKLMTNPFPTFLNDLLVVSKNGKRLLGVLIVH